MAQFQRAKRQFELKIAPLLIEEVNEKLNTTWINSLKEKVEELKKNIDSDYFQVLELQEHQPNPHQISRWPIMVFLTAAIFCLLCSSIFHLFYPMSSSNSFFIQKSIPSLIVLTMQASTYSFLVVLFLPSTMACIANSMQPLSI